jgi:hypothetical protein
MPFLGTLLSGIPVKTIMMALAAAVVAAFLFIAVHAIRENGALKAQLDAAIEVANNNSKIAEDQAKTFKAAQAVIAKGEQKKQAIRAQADVIREEISHAPPEDDGPVAPVLRRELDRLLEPAVNPGNRS